jgi:hypothetical protein
VRTLRHLQAAAPACFGAVRLAGAFAHGGHMCLVLERAFPSLLDYLSESAALPAPARLANLRSIARQLLVSFPLGSPPHPHACASAPS